MPGAIVDSYAGVLVVQLYTAGIDRLQKELVAALVEVCQPRGILMRNDMTVRVREGLTKEEPRVVYGEVPSKVVVKKKFQVQGQLVVGTKNWLFHRPARQTLALQNTFGRPFTQLL